MINLNKIHLDTRDEFLENTIHHFRENVYVSYEYSYRRFLESNNIKLSWSSGFNHRIEITSKLTNLTFFIEVDIDSVELKQFICEIIGLWESGTWSFPENNEKFYKEFFGD